MTNPFYIFTIEHEGLAVELWLNDIRIDSDPNGVFKTRRFVNNLYIIDGENTLKVKIGLPGQPPRLPESVELKVKLHEVDRSALSEKQLPEPIAELSFPGKDMPSFPAEIETTVQIKSPFGRWSWQDADKVESDNPRLLPECFSMISSLHNALTAKDIQPVEKLVSIKNAEMARAYYIPIDQRNADQHKFFQDIFDDAQFGMEPLDKENLRISAMAGNRLFFVEQKDGSPALESTELSEGYCFSLPVQMSKIDGIWKIVR